jgi:hypothetical protein
VKEKLHLIDLESGDLMVGYTEDLFFMKSRRKFREGEI